MNRPRFSLLAAALLTAAALGLAGCKAGPSAFDRGQEQTATGDVGVEIAANLPSSESTEVLGTVDPLLRQDLEPFSAAVEETSYADGEAVLDVEAGSDAGTQSEGDEWVPDPDARFPRPRKVRGIYVNAWAGGSQNRMDALLDLARRTEVNSFVIDIKDASGYVSHRTEVPLAHESGATEEVRIRDLAGLLDRLESEGIYPIARIVIVKDPILAEFMPELAVQDTAGGVWVDRKGIVWLNPYDERVWEYHVDLAREVAELGFPEIQWDYVRFPDAPRSDLDRAVFAGADGRLKAEVIREFLQYSRSALADLGVFATADVFGVATSATRDVGIGQHWESMVDVVDALLPMVYPSHYSAGSFGLDEPNAYPYEIVRGALRDAQRRSADVEGAGATRPWLQDFTLGPPIYGGPEVRAQIQAAYDAGVDEWVLWNPGSRYTETALEPVDGFEYEPIMRVAGGLFPVSRRREAIDSVRNVREAALLAGPVETLDSDATDLMEWDTLGAVELDYVDADTLRLIEQSESDAVRADTLGVGR